MRIYSQERDDSRCYINKAIADDNARHVEGVSTVGQSNLILVVNVARKDREVFALHSPQLVARHTLNLCFHPQHMTRQRDAALAL